MLTGDGMVSLTDEAGNEIGVADALSSHRGEGRMHRAFSVFVFHEGRTLLQRRSPAKRRFPGLWSNTCCGHPMPGTSVVEAAERRLMEEMGFTASLEEAATFVYRAVDPSSGLVEHEFDHVLVGRFDGKPRPDPLEADAWAWTEVHDLRSALTKSASAHTPWLGAALDALATRSTPWVR